MTPFNKDFGQACVYIAPTDRVRELRSELKNILFEKDNFLLAKGPIQKVYWAQNIWKDVRVTSVESIKKGAFFLKAIQRNWWHYPLSSVRRSKLIQSELLKIKNSKLVFPSAAPQEPLGSFALISDSEMIYSATCSETMPNGEYLFEDPTYETPSTAYLKLWEALSRMGYWPGPGDYCVDIGSSPGSWTQALLALRAKVFSVDRSDLEIAASPQLEFLRKDAFKVDPSDINNPSWIFSDIICYPERLLELALTWKKAHPKANFVFTIKFHSEWNREVVQKLAKIPGSQVVRLFNNKHELCWIKRAQQV